MTKQYRSEVMASIHETATDLHAAGVMDKKTMRKFDEACLTPVRPLTPTEIKALREREGAKSGGVCALPERNDRPGEPVGAWRETPTRPLSQAAVTGRSRRAGGCRMKPPHITA